jgi:hypothetical protein
MQGVSEMALQRCVMCDDDANSEMLWTQYISNYLNDKKQFRFSNADTAKPSENTTRRNNCVCWLPWKSCLSGCYLDTDLSKSYLVTGIPNMWDVSMGGSHNGIPNVTVWRVLRKSLHLKKYKLSIVQHFRCMNILPYCNFRIPQGSLHTND